jgi:hypothetical protein
LELEGELSFHEKTAVSGNVVKRGFCPKCGCHIYAQKSGLPQLEFLRVSSLHDLEAFEPTIVVYASSGASWDYIDPKLPKSDTMP